MPVGEKEVKIAHRMYECRDGARSLAKIRNEDYFELIKPYSEILSSVMVANKLEPIPALLVIADTQTYQESGMRQLLFLAALTEILEPSANA